MNFDRSVLLLVPPKGDTTLLAREPFGGRMPTLTHGDDCIAWGDYGGDCSCGIRALVLAVDGNPAPVGCDRAMRWCRAHPRANSVVIYPPQPRAVWMMRYALDVADFAAHLGCRVVIAAKDGKEWREGAQQVPHV